MIDSRAVHGSCGWLTMIYRCILSPVCTGLILMICLCGRRVYMCFSCCRLFLGIWPGIYAMRATIITDPVIYYRRIMYDDRIVYIYISDNRTIYVDDCRIIPERISLPSASAETGAIITITIIHATIKTDMRSPVTMMKSIVSTGISPVSRRP